MIHHFAVAAVVVAIWAFGFASGAVAKGMSDEKYRQENEELRESAYRAWAGRQGAAQ